MTFYQFDSKSFTTSDGNWDDFVVSASAVRLDSAATRYSFDTTNLGIQFDSDSRYPEEQISIIYQLPHEWKIGSDIRFHFHWIQSQSAIPNWLLDYRWFDNNEAEPSFTRLSGTTETFSYTSGSILQISHFGLQSSSGITGVSSNFEIKFWRDTANTSTEFSGADPVATDVRVKFFDIHLQQDSPGSDNEFSKTF